MPTMTKLASHKVSSSGLTYIQFDSIPSSYFDLHIRGFVKSTKSDNVNGYAAIRTYLRADTTDANYSRMYYETYAGTTNTGVGKSATSNAYIPSTSSGNTANAFGMYNCYIHNYASSNTYKSFWVDSSQPASGGTYEQFWIQNASYYTGSTAAISSVRITIEGAYTVGSQFELYGVEKYGSAGSGTASVTTG